MHDLLQEMLLLEATTRQTETDEFKSWFGSSKVVDENGDPRVMYHLTSKDFDTFKHGGSDNPEIESWISGGEKRSMTGASGKGFWFSVDPNKTPAAHHATGRAPGDNIKPVYLKAISPLIMDDDLTDWAVDAFAEGHEEFPLLITDQAYNNLKSSGYDSIFIYREGQDSAVDDPVEVVVLDSNQIKSAMGNKGTFKSDSDNIVESSRL